MNRIEREKETVGRMIALYCRNHHHADDGGLCADCTALLEYACRRLARCPKGEQKSSCKRCEIHCYAPSYRAEIRKVMKYSGPRMISVHPVAAIRHLLSGVVSRLMNRGGHICMF